MSFFINIYSLVEIVFSLIFISIWIIGIVAIIKSLTIGKESNSMLSLLNNSMIKSEVLIFNNHQHCVRCGKVIHKIENPTGNDVYYSDFFDKGLCEDCYKTKHGK